MSGFIRRGRCWRFGDNVALDGDIMPLELAMARETRPEVLKKHLLTGLDPAFPDKVAVGDIIVAGKRFAQGNPHIQGFLAMAAFGLGLAVATISRSSFRLAISAGVPILPRCTDATAAAASGDEIEIDFAAGRFRNLTQNTERRYEPLDPALLAIVANGGWMATFKKRLAAAR